MQLIRHKRSLAALLPFALACLAGPPAAWAVRTQEANVVPVAILSVRPEGIEDWPRQVRSEMLLASDGNIYFSSVAGGDGTGAVARLTADGTLTTIYSFTGDGNQGASAFGALEEIDGLLYGTTYIGGADGGGGTLFRLALDGTGFTVLHTFGGGDPNPLFPYTGVTQGPDGYLYGTTHSGGTSNKGVIYRIATDGSDFSVLHEFTGASGAHPQGKLTVGLDGMLYGTTAMGGDEDNGTIYRISTAGAHERLFSFPKRGAFGPQGLPVNATGAHPRGGLLLNDDGSFLGTAERGGEFGYGTLFRLTPEGDLSIVRNFAGPSLDGGNPAGNLTRDLAGNLYGTTQAGGYLQRGSAWRLTPEGEFQLLHGFIGSSIDGVMPMAGVLPAHGTLYTASQFDSGGGGGSGGSGSGLILKLDTGAGGVLPLSLELTDADVMLGDPVTISWNAPAGSTCTKTGGTLAWPGEASVAGSQELTLAPGTYAFGMRCNEADDGNEATPIVIRSAYAVLIVKAPPLQPVDGGGGAGSISLLWLLLAAALLFHKIRKETPSPCP